MPVLSATYYGSPGSTAITAPELAYVKILHVERSGLGYEEVDTVPAEGARTFKYGIATGKIVFDPYNPFAYPDPSSSVDTGLERVLVIYRT